MICDLPPKVVDAAMGYSVQTHLAAYSRWCGDDRVDDAFAKGGAAFSGGIRNTSSAFKNARAKSGPALRIAQVPLHRFRLDRSAGPWPPWRRDRGWPSRCSTATSQRFIACQQEPVRVSLDAL